MTGPTPEQVTVEPDDLISHAGAVDDIGYRTDAARQVGEHIRIDNGMYGLLCQEFPLLLSPITIIVTTAIDQSATGLHNTAQRLRELAYRYAATDDRSAVRFDDIGSDLGGTGP